MKKYVGYELGKVVILNLERDDLLLETIERELQECGIRNALLTSAIGSLQKVVLHRVVGMGREPEDEFVTLEKPMELASLQGVVLDGKAHFHMVVSDVEQAQRIMIGRQGGLEEKKKLAGNLAGIKSL